MRSRTPPAPPPPNLIEIDRVERLKTRAKAYLSLKGFPKLSGDPLSAESLLEAVLHYAEQDLPPEIDPQKEREAMRKSNELAFGARDRDFDKKED